MRHRLTPAKLVRCGVELIVRTCLCLTCIVWRLWFWHQRVRHHGRTYSDGCKPVPLQARVGDFEYVDSIKLAKRNVGHSSSCWPFRTTTSAHGAFSRSQDNSVTAPTCTTSLRCGLSASLCSLTIAISVILQSVTKSCVTPLHLS